MSRKLKYWAAGMLFFFGFVRQVDWKTAVDPVEREQNAERGEDGIDQAPFIKLPKTPEPRTWNSVYKWEGSIHYCASIKFW